ncbi:MAG: toxin TcdB middle/N-terminal domain-containing protein [Pseudomonadota bacterium]
MEKNGAAPTAVAPPSGTGFTAGLGENFSLDLNSGQVTFSIPFDLPDGVAGHKPNVTLEYVHGQGNGPFGQGWRLKMREISRRLDLGTPEAEAREVFFDGPNEIRERGDGSFASIRESMFSRYERQGDGWLIREKDGRREIFGDSATARIADPDHPDCPVTWMMERAEDVNGNAITYAYDSVEGWAYLRTITYATYTVRFEYEDRPDLVTNGRAGFLRRLTRRCASITAELTATGEVFRRLNLGYETGATGQSILVSAQLSAHRTGLPDVVKNPLRLSYLDFDASIVALDLIEGVGGSQPPSLEDPETALVALDDLPLPGVVANVNGRLTYWGNDGRGGWTLPRPLDQTPHMRSFGADGIQFLDMNGSGRPDMLVGIGGNPLNGYYENKGRDGFGQFVPRPAGSNASPPLESARLRVADTTGNGLVDALYSEGRGLVTYRNAGRSGWAEPAIAPKPEPITLADPLTHLVDMTGDGMPDLVRVRSGAVTYWPALGHGRFGDPVEMVASPRLAGIHRTPGQVMLLDVDGDGCADMVRIGPKGIEIYLNQHGSGFAAPVVHSVIPTPIPGSVRAADFRGNGRFGLVYSTQRGSGIAHVHLHLGDDTRPYLLQSVDNGMGLETTISYQSMTEMALRDRDEGRLWATSMPFPIWVVSATEERDTVRGRSARCEYRYHDGHFDPLFRRFQGFGDVDKIELGDATHPDTRTQHRFLMNRSGAPGATRSDAHLDRLLAEVTVFQLDGTADEDRPMQREETTYSVEVLENLPDGSERVFVAVNTSRQICIDRTNDERVEERSFEYDAFGNVTLETVVGTGLRDGAPADERSVTTEITYATNPDQTIFKAAQTVKRDAGGAIILEQRMAYDGQPLGQLTRGHCTREEHLALSEADFAQHYAGMDRAALGYFNQPDADGAAAVFALSMEKTYAPDGNLLAETTGAGRNVTRTFDADGLHMLTEETNGKTSTYVPDPIHGKPLRITSAAGGVVRMRYDAFGRLSHFLLADDTEATATRIIEYDDTSLPVSLSTSYRIDTGTRSFTRTYHDGRGQEVQKRAERAPGDVVVSGWSVQNAFSQTVEEFEPTLGTSLEFAVPDTTGLPSRRTRFDALGRPVGSVNYNGGTSRVDYAPFRITTWSANDEEPGHPEFDTPRVEEVDVWNFRTAIVDQGPDGPVRLGFRIGDFGELLEHSDAIGTIASYSYDRRGNRLQVTHRDAGRREQWFDAHNDAVRARDAKGHDVTAERDRDGRVTRVVLNGNEIERFTYGDTDPNADGRLVHVTYGAGEQRFTYTDRGHLGAHQITMDGQDFEFAYTLNDMGRQTSLTYPDGTLLTRSYSANGMVTGIDGVIDLITYDARNLPIEVRYSNGVTSTYDYEPGVGHLRSQRTVGPAGAVIEDVTYSYDALMRLVARDDTAPGGERVAWTHDSLDQMTGASFERGGTVDSLGFTHANTFNLESIGGSGWTLGYGDTARPDRLTEITEPGESALAVTHDGNGNLEALPGQVLEYDFKNQLERVTLSDGTEVRYAYDYRGNRIRREVTRGGTTTVTIYLGRMVEITNGQTTRYVLLDGQRVAMDRTGARRWFHLDHLGSATRFSDETGTVIAEIAYAPFGTERRRSGSPPLRIFSLHDYDEVTGLIYMALRWYSPDAGRFLTPDPLFLHEPDRAEDSQVMLRLYTFTGNRPSDRSDPHGLSFWSVFGAIVGVIIGIALAPIALAGIGMMLGGLLTLNVVSLVAGALILAPLIGITTVSYAIAHNNQGQPLGEFFRGFMIGMNAGLNAGVLTMLGAGSLGVAIGVLGFLGSIDGIASSEVYQGIIGWSNWVSPMSWLVTIPGALMWMLNGLGHLIFWSFPQLWNGGIQAFRITGMRMDWQTGMLSTRGGWITAGMPANALAFNMGNFSWVHPRSGADWHMDHEAGHNLNLAVFGSIFHYIGAIHEVPLGAGLGAFAEIHAESNNGGPGMWS